MHTGHMQMHADSSMYTNTNRRIQYTIKSKKQEERVALYPNILNTVVGWLQ